MTFGTDPWRYKCPWCSSVDVRKRVSGTETPHGGGKPALGEYYCKSCNSPQPFLTDAKTGKRAKP